MDNFKASTKYGDLRGSCAADNSDMCYERVADWLKSQGKIDDGEHVIGMKLFIGENHGVHRDPVSVKFLVSGLKGYSNIPEMIESFGDQLEVKVIDVNMDISDFLRFFKRLELSLSHDGILESKRFTSIEG